METIVLGLSINTRMLGLAVVTGNYLVDFYVQMRKEPWTPRKREHILTSLHSCCSTYSISNVALSIPHEAQTSPQTKELITSLKNFCKNKKITLACYPPQAIYSFCEEGKTKTKKEVMRKMVELYPELCFHYTKEIRNKHRYYIKLFEAVAIATLHSRKLEGSRA